MIKVLHPGIYTTVQDSGRYGSRDMGVPISGAMDQYAMHFANHLLGNDPSNAVLEMTMMGPKIEFECATNIAITGANFIPQINGAKRASYEKISVKAGDVLSLQPPKLGTYGYIAFEGGLQTEEILGSRSFYSGITAKDKLEKGDELHIDQVENSINETHFASINYTPDYLNQETVEVAKGPEWNLLSEATQKQILENRFSIHPSSNRMAIILDHSLELSAKEIITGPVQPGTIQLTPSGNLIALMRDAQTSGGYSRVLQLTSKGQNELCQVKSGESVKLSLLKNR